MSVFSYIIKHAWRWSFCKNAQCSLIHASKKWSFAAFGCFMAMWIKYFWVLGVTHHRKMYLWPPVMVCTFHYLWNILKVILTWSEWKRNDLKDDGKVGKKWIPSFSLGFHTVLEIIQLTQTYLTFAASSTSMRFNYCF